MSTTTGAAGEKQVNQAISPNVARALSVDAIGRFAIRYGLVAVILYIGLMKFTSYEAQAISGLISSSPLLAWTYSIFSVGALAASIGSSEILIAGLIAIRPWSAKASAIGSALAVGMFLTTLSFMFTTPGVIEPSIGFPGLSVMPGQFLVKDIALLGIAVWTFSDSFQAISRKQK